MPIVLTDSPEQLLRDIEKNSKGVEAFVEPSGRTGHGGWCQKGVRERCVSLR
jgi:hypothetical protein